jgi:hypothetical protein
MFDYASRLGKPRGDAEVADSYEPPWVAGDEGSYFWQRIRAPYLLRRNELACRSLFGGEIRPKPSIHAAFSEVSPAVDLTIMQAASHLHNLGIALVTHPIQEIARGHADQDSIQIRETDGD